MFLGLTPGHGRFRQAALGRLAPLPGGIPRHRRERRHAATVRWRLGSLPGRDGGRGGRRLPRHAGAARPLPPPPARRRTTEPQELWPPAPSRSTRSSWWRSRSSSSPRRSIPSRGSTPSPRPATRSRSSRPVGLDVRHDGRTVTGDDLHNPTLVVQAGRTIRFRIISRDVIHSFWIPAQRFKRDAFPQRWTEFDLTFDRPARTSGGAPSSAASTTPTWASRRSRCPVATSSAGWRSERRDAVAVAPDVPGLVGWLARPTTSGSACCASRASFVFFLRAGPWRSLMRTRARRARACRSSRTTSYNQLFTMHGAG